MRAFVIPLCLVLVGCASATEVVAVPSRVPTAVSSEEATLIVANTASWRVVNLLDENGRLVGQLNGRSHVVIARPAGPFKLYAVPEADASRGDRIEGTLERGRLYSASVGMRWGGASLTVTHDDCELGRVELDAAKVPTLMQELGDTRAITVEIDRRVERLDTDARQARTVKPVDGEPLALASRR
jgi:hypothetical protein